MQLRYSIHSWYVSFWLTNSFPSLAIPLMPMVGWCQWLVNSKLCVCVCILSVLLVEVLSIPPIYSLSLSLCIFHFSYSHIWVVCLFLYPRSLLLVWGYVIVSQILLMSLSLNIVDLWKMFIYS